MKGLVATTAVLGVLAIGGLPALALTLASEETGPDTEPTTTLVEDADDTGRPGPPPWAQGRGPGEDRGDEGDSETEDEGEPGWARGGNDEPPPGWARNHDGRIPHGWAVREWASCLADQAGDRQPGEPVDPEGVCGEKPESPGQAKRSDAAAVPPGQQGRSAAPGQQGRDEPPGQASKPEKTKKPKTG